MADELTGDGSLSADVSPTPVAPAPAEEGNVIDLAQHLTEALNPKQEAALRESKKAKAAKAAKKSLEVETPAAGLAQPSTSEASQPAQPSSTAEADGENIIDLSAPVETPTVEGETPEPDVKGLDEATKKKVLDVHKENAKIRKRAQEAEKERDAIKSEREQMTQRITELESRPATASNNLFRAFNEESQVDVWAQDAQARINLILDRNTLEKVHKLPNGEEIDLAEDEIASLTQAQQILAHAADWRAVREQHGQSLQKARPTVEAFKKVPEYASLHREIAQQDPHAHWPQIVSRAAIGALVESGQYVLVKKSSAKAAGANSPAPAVSGARPDAANSSPGSPPVEVTGAVPSASRESTSGGAAEIPSALRERASKGDQEAVMEIIRLKTQGSKRRAA